MEQNLQVAILKITIFLLLGITNFGFLLPLSWISTRWVKRLFCIFSGFPCTSCMCGGSGSVELDAAQIQVKYGILLIISL